MAVNQEIINKIQDRQHINGKELAELFMNLVNSMGSSTSDFSEVITKEHRYLQQEAFNLFFACIEQWSKHDHYDVRNEYAVKASKVMFEALKSSNLF